MSRQARGFWIIVVILRLKEGDDIVFLVMRVV